ncbi:uracil-DNA glycosylase [Rugamonas sp. DEMB1]|uniref:uracil-DNA glycosylase n=1 Tax=Rugamonas sp. DEMB1 TaxID=3039386 RepID=UPI0024492BCC|nr:uracil-DNA glycosylase [Rugamonas sp. DEMB1]WGG48616.1 uracil-DNA glycosylase [Rugamonas sp. DEMB1]
MSQITGRSAVFLEEMGVGPQWSRRNLPPAGAMPEPIEAPAELLAEDEAPAMQSAASFAAAVMAAVADDLPDGAAAIAAMSAAPPALAPVLAAEVAARSHDDALEHAAASAPLAEAAPASVAARAPAAAVPAMPVAADVADGVDDADSTAWFDDAPTPARAAPIADEAIAALDWAGLKQAIASCTRCDLCATRRGTVPGRGEGSAGWIAIGAAPSRLDEKENRAITGDGGQLLANMLKAIALAPDTDVHVTNLVKCRPSDADGADRRPTPDEVAACRPFLERELVLSGAAMVLTLGQAAAKGLLGAAARGQVLRYGALPVVATYHPEDLLRRPEDKAKAWADLCLARAAHAGEA